MRNIKQELLEIKGGNFPQWYASLTKLEKVEYHNALEQLSKEFKVLS
tara:strand:+ start:780 stop:920 length:141 start_codon:yes stop_codon:yes gene_type:complete